MDFPSYLKKSELTQLMDYFHLEIIAFNLQDLLFTKEFIPLSVKRQGTMRDLFLDQFNFNLSYYSLTPAPFKLRRHAPNFQNKGAQFLCFDDDLWEFYSPENLTSPVFSLKGRQILVNCDIKPQNVSSLLEPGDYFLKITAGLCREEVRRYLQRMDDKEWEEKSSFFYNLHHLCYKQLDLLLAEEIFNRRKKLFPQPLPFIKFEVAKGSAVERRAKEIIKHYDLSDFKLWDVKSCIQIQWAFDLFSMNISNQLFLHQIKTPRSYESHLKKFIRQLNYLYKKTQRAKL